jgi:hypothetical protein
MVITSDDRIIGITGIILGGLCAILTIGIALSIFTHKFYATNIIGEFNVGAIIILGAISLLGIFISILVTTIGIYVLQGKANLSP